MFVTVPEGSVYVVERLGRFHALLPPGRHFVMPVLDRVARRFATDGSIRLEEKRATVTYRIADPRRAHENVADVEEALRRLMAMVLTDMAETRSAVASANQLAEGWGVAVKDVVVDRF